MPSIDYSTVCMCVLYIVHRHDVAKQTEAEARKRVDANSAIKIARRSNSRDRIASDRKTPGKFQKKKSWKTSERNQIFEGSLP